ncbi:hypothetical protein ACFV83_23250 [Streptomyces pharetrae]|uniref:hypothetical protein n=1 Tax=Streptomyces pharetrae TaxID=291370 RepID=UPI00364DD801
MTIMGVTRHGATSSGSTMLLSEVRRTIGRCSNVQSAYLPDSLLRTQPAQA